MPCKCGRPLVKSPMNPKVKLCDGCLNQKANCTCEKLDKPRNAGEAAQALFDAVTGGYR